MTDDIPEVPAMTTQDYRDWVKTNAEMIQRHEKQIKLLTAAFLDYAKSLNTDLQFITKEVFKVQSDDYRAGHKYTNREVFKRLDEMQSKLDYFTDRVNEKNTDPLKKGEKL